MAGIHMIELSKQYAEQVQAIDAVNLSVADQSLMVLLGPSGCGKSTLLRSIAGLETVTSGDIYIGARRVNDVPPGQRDVAMVFQDYALYPHMTVYENMAFGLKQRRMPRRQIAEKVHEAAQRLEIEPILRRKPGRLSGGQQQRVALGRAMVRHPAVFLFDEPLSNLDAQLRLTMRDELKTLQRHLATTTLHVTHDQEEAMVLADRLAVMSEGQVQQVGQPLTIYQQPHNRFVAGFLGNPPMNFIPGRLTVQPQRLTFEDDAMHCVLPTDAASTIHAPQTRSVVLGLRPEAISLEPDDASAHRDNADPAVWRARLIDLQPLGPDMHATLMTTAGQTLRARIPAQQATLPEAVRARFDPDAAHLFEPGPYGQNLTLSD
jgi:multiple sugar transport system ATP-binding protein